MTKMKMQQQRKGFPNAKSQREFASTIAEVSALEVTKPPAILSIREAKEPRIKKICDSGKAAHDPNRFVEAIRIRGF
jgi:hypothetical protein